MDNNCLAYNGLGSVRGTHPIIESQIFADYTGLVASRNDCEWLQPSGVLQQVS